MVPGGWKFFYAFSLPAVLVLCALTQVDGGIGYWLLMTGLIVAGGVCAARVMPAGNPRWGIMLAYIAVLEALLWLLP